MSRLRAGVIGAGSWAQAAHIPALLARPEVELVAVARRGPEQVAALKERFGVETASEDYRDVLDAEPDLVVVSSPSAHHLEHAMAALDSGAHVLCEKPMTIRARDAWQLAERADQLGLHLVMSFGWNFKPMVERARELVGRHRLGRVESMMLTMSSQTRELLGGDGTYPDADPLTTPEPHTWTDPELSGGGYAQAQLSHALALGLGLAGARVEAAFALTVGADGSAVEMHDALALRLDGGGVCSVGGSSAYTGVDDNQHHLALEVVAEGGQLMVDVGRERVSLFTPGHGQVDLDVGPEDGRYDGQLPVNGLVDLVCGLRDDNPAGGELGARVTEALELVYRSARSGALEVREKHR